MSKSLLFSVALVGMSIMSGSVVGDDDTEEITGWIYADNYFEFYFNGEYIKNDSIGFIPHNAEYVSFTAPKNGTRTFAILAKDFSDDVTALEYDNNCIGDGGLRAFFSDGTGMHNNSNSIFCFLLL